jgi:hypothetical protein
VRVAFPAMGLISWDSPCAHKNRAALLSVAVVFLGVHLWVPTRCLFLNEFRDRFAF